MGIGPSSLWRRAFRRGSSFRSICSVDDNARGLRKEYEGQAKPAGTEKRVEGSGERGRVSPVWGEAPREACRSGVRRSRGLSGFAAGVASDGCEAAMPRAGVRREFSGCGGGEATPASDVERRAPARAPLCTLAPCRDGRPWMAGGQGWVAQPRKALAAWPRWPLAAK